MDERKGKLLGHIIEEYVSSGHPVGSALISEKLMRDVSSPTIRNEMQDLEREGFIRQPHTSAGRIPTELGYRHYLENIMRPVDLSKKERKFLEDSVSSGDKMYVRAKSAAKKAAQLSGEAVVVGFASNDVYYTGLSNLFNKPEFRDHDFIITVSEVIDRLDEVMSGIGSKLDEDISVFLGQDNPFGVECASVITLTKSGIVFGMLGPIRMNYGQNIAFVKFIKKLLS
jgi:heat-inducible transcriptional repressor